jgi:hypothetical protein
LVPLNPTPKGTHAVPFHLPISPAEYGPAAVNHPPT